MTALDDYLEALGAFCDSFSKATEAGKVILDKMQRSILDWAAYSTPDAIEAKMTTWSEESVARWRPIFVEKGYLPGGTE